MRYLASLILAAGLAVGFGAPAQAQFASALQCDFFVPATGGGFAQGRCVPASVLSGYHVKNIEESGGVVTITWNDGDNSDGTADETTVFTIANDGNSFATGVDLDRTGRNLSINITGNTGFTGLTDTVALPDETHVDSGTISGTPPVLDLHLSDGTDVTITGLPEGTTEWTGLTDTPSSIVADNCVKGNNAGDALSFGSCGSGGGTGTADGKVIDFVAAISGAALSFTVEQNEGLSNIVELLTLTEPTIPNLPASKITTGEFGTVRLADDAVTQAKLANNSVHARADRGQRGRHFGDFSANAVGTSELSADAVTNANLADDSVHNDQLAANSVRADEIQANAVGHVRNATMTRGGRGRVDYDERCRRLRTCLATTAPPCCGWLRAAVAGASARVTALSDTRGAITAYELRARQSRRAMRWWLRPARRAEAVAPTIRQPPRCPVTMPRGFSRQL